MSKRISYVKQYDIKCRIYYMEIMWTIFAFIFVHISFWKFKNIEILNQHRMSMNFISCVRSFAHTLILDHISKYIHIRFAMKSGINTNKSTICLIVHLLFSIFVLSCCCCDGWLDYVISTHLIREFKKCDCLVEQCEGVFRCKSFFICI